MVTFYHQDVELTNRLKAEKSKSKKSKKVKKSKN